MTDETIVQVKIVDSTESEMKEIYDVLRADFANRDDIHVVVTDGRVDISEIPSLDDNIDEIVERLSEKIRG